MDKIEILDKIVALVAPLKPPVQDFENSIHTSPFRILVSVLLSSRTKDPVTRQASENLFAVADTPMKMAELGEERIAQLIYPVGFYREKSKHIKALSRILSETYDGKVPDSFDSLTKLPGVGRKTANLVIALAFNRPAICVDIHVFRISQRLGWAKGKKPEEIEKQLMQSFPPEHWNRINQTLVGFGQTICKPVSPLCEQCSVSQYCLYFKEKSGKLKK